MDSELVPSLDPLRPILQRLTEGREPGDRLLVGPKGGVLTTAAVRDATNRDQLVAKLELPDLTRHGLRDAGATWMAATGVPLHVLHDKTSAPSVSPRAQRHDRSFRAAARNLDTHYPDIYCPGMRFSDGVEWSIHSCLVLAELPDGVGLPVARLAEYHELPAAYLAKHMQALSRAGIVTSIPGRGGGYRLSRPASQITIAEVVTAIEGARSAFRCTEIRRRGPGALESCRYDRACLVARTMAGAEQAWYEELARSTLADLAFTPSTEDYQKMSDWLSRVLKQPG